MEISKGVISIAEGLQYYHSVAKRIHTNLSPESVVVTAAGQWKLCGLGLSLAYVSSSEQLAASPYFLKQVSDVACRQRLQPDQAYASPEMTAGDSVRYLRSASDVFSLALLSLDLYRFAAASPSGRVFMPTISIPENSSADYHAAALPRLLAALDMSVVPAMLGHALQSMLAIQSANRM